MRLTLTLLGWTFDVSLTPDTAETEGAELAGGTLGSDRIEPGSTDRWMGFTNGLEVGDDDRCADRPPRA